MTDEKVFEYLQEFIGGASEVAKLASTFEVVRNKKHGGIQIVTVNIFDRGLDVDPYFRYYCVATGDDGATATGNPGESIEAVLSTVHWFALDEHK